MAIDNTPPRLKLIVTIGAITVITLFGISFATQSYFAMMTDEAKHEKIAPTRDKEEQLKAEGVALTGAAIPLDKAMAQVANGGRPDAITPNASDDLGAMTGWAKLPKAAPVAQPKQAGLDPMIGDGGATLSTDGGAMLGPDGGVMLSAPIGDAGAPSDRDGGVRHGRGTHGGNH